MYKSETVRVSVDLDRENYEISFLNLIKKRLQIEVNTDEINKMTKFVNRIELKIGPIAVMNGQIVHVNDYRDQAVGYDCNDTFIDDSGEEEALAVIPDLITKKGGFFANRGILKLNDDSFTIEIAEGLQSPINIQISRFSHKSINKKSISQQLVIQAKKRLKHSSQRKISDDSKINEVVAVDKILEENNTEKITNKNDLNEIEGQNNAQEIEKDVIQLNNDVATAKIEFMELPAKLSDVLLEKIHSFIIMFEKYKVEGVKVSPEINSALLELEIMIIENHHGMSTTRANIYQYICQNVGIQYSAILKKIWRIKDIKRKQKLKPLFKALENAIKVEIADSESENKTAKEQYLKSIGITEIYNDNIMNKWQMSDQELDPNTSNEIITFKWTDNSKYWFFKLVYEELDAFRIKNERCSAEEHLKKFFEVNVIQIFPSNSMLISELMKMSEPLLMKFNYYITTIPKKGKANSTAADSGGIVKSQLVTKSKKSNKNLPLSKKAIRSASDIAQYPSDYHESIDLLQNNNEHNQNVRRSICQETNFCQPYLSNNPSSSPCGINIGKNQARSTTVPHISNINSQNDTSNAHADLLGLDTFGSAVRLILALALTGLQHHVAYVLRDFSFRTFKEENRN